MQFDFQEPENLGVLSTKNFINDQQPVLRVVHEHDGYWQFLTAEFLQADTEEKLTAAEEGAMLVCLKDVVSRDTTLNALADLAPGEFADRGFVGDEWIRASFDEETEEEQ